MELLPFVKGQLNGFDFIDILYDRKATFKCLIGLYIIAIDQNVFFVFLICISLLIKDSAILRAYKMFT